MSSLTTSRPPVKAERLPYRPLLSAPQAAYWTDEVGAFHILLSGKRATKSYELLALSTDIGGAAFRWFKQGGECYDVLVNGVESSCSCRGWAFTSGCKHLQTTAELLQLGVLSVAPGTAGGECDDAA